MFVIPRRSLERHLTVCLEETKKQQQKPKADEDPLQGYVPIRKTRPTWPGFKPGSLRIPDRGADHYTMHAPGGDHLTYPVYCPVQVMKLSLIHI